jgi:hypothetical protein
VSFNATIFEQTTAYWTDDLINIQMIADARLARMLDSVKYNPMFALSELAGAFSAGEGAAYLLVFGNKTEMTARKDLVKYLFGMSNVSRVPYDIVLMEEQRMNACPQSWAGQLPTMSLVLMTSLAFPT